LSFDAVFRFHFFCLSLLFKKGVLECSIKMILEGSDVHTKETFSRKGNFFFVKTTKDLFQSKIRLVFSCLPKYFRCEERNFSSSSAE